MHVLYAQGFFYFFSIIKVMEKETRIALIIVLTVIGVLAFLHFSGFYRFSWRVVDKTPAIFANKEVSEALIEKSQLSFPRIKSESFIDKLPQGLEIFVPLPESKTAQDLVVKKVVYNGDKVGYIVEFSFVPLSAKKISPLFFNNPSSLWETPGIIKFGSYQVFEIKNAEYSVRVIHQYLNEDFTNVVVQAIEN